MPNRQHALLNFLDLSRSGGNAIQTAYEDMENTKSEQELSIGDKVTFDNNQVELFKAETASPEKSVRQYQQLILGGIDQVGIVKSINDNLTTVAYPDGWELPVPTKYLILLK